MLTQTSETAIRAMLFLAVHAGSGQPYSPKTIAEEIGGSATYLCKVLRILTKTGLVRAYRGSHGGVLLDRPPESITLLDIVEACQGIMDSGACQRLSAADLPHACAFHQAMQAAHDATVGVLRQWTVKDLLACPRPSDPALVDGQCRLAMACTLSTPPPPRPPAS